MLPIDDPTPLSQRCDDDAAQAVDEPLALSDFCHDAEAVVIDARQIETEAEALAAAWSAMLDAGGAEPIWTSDDDETGEHLGFLEESAAVRQEADGIVVDALRVQEDAEASSLTEPAPAEPEPQSEANAPVPSSIHPTDTLPGASVATDSADDELAAPSPDAPAESEDQPDAAEKKVADATSGTTRPASTRRIGRNPATGQGSKRSTRNRN